MIREAAVKKKKHEITLSLPEKEYAYKILYSRYAVVGCKKRANILLMSDQSAGKPAMLSEIAERSAVSNVTVYNTIRDYCEHGIEYALTIKRPDKPPRPPIVTEKHAVQIAALASGEPPEGYSRWSIRLLTEKIVELAILPTASRETVRCTLKKLNLSLT